MKLIRANCRAQFTAEDFAYIARVLGQGRDQEGSVLRLLTDEETRDLLLDDPALLRAMIEDGSCVRVSSHFYFYILVRQVLLRAGIDDRVVADYVAELLVEFSRTERQRCILPGQGHPVEYCFEMLAALPSADDRTRFLLRTHIGNLSLFLCGLWSERIRWRAERRGFPDVGYYEALGRTNFRAASDHQLARRYEVAEVFDTLSRRFQTTRRALNDLTDRLVFLGDGERLAGLGEVAGGLN